MTQHDLTLIDQLAAIRQGGAIDRATAHRSDAARGH